MPGFREDSSKSLVNFRLEGLERNTFSIYADIAITSAFGNDSIAEDLAIPHTWDVEKLSIFDSKHHLKSGHARDVTVDAYEIHVPIVGYCSLEE